MYTHEWTATVRSRTGQGVHACPVNLVYKTDLLEIRRLILNKFKSSVWRFVFFACRFVFWFLGCLCVFLLLLAQRVSGLTCSFVDLAEWACGVGSWWRFLSIRRLSLSHGSAYAAHFSCASTYFSVACGLQLRFFRLHVGCKWYFSFQLHDCCNRDFSSYIYIAT
jgi:hypothetical protein